MKKEKAELDFIDNADKIADYIHRLMVRYKSIKGAEIAEDYRINKIVGRFDKPGKF